MLRLALLDGVHLRFWIVVVWYAYGGVSFGYY